MVSKKNIEQKIDSNFITKKELVDFLSKKHISIDLKLNSLTKTQLISLFKINSLLKSQLIVGLKNCDKNLVNLNKLNKAELVYKYFIAYNDGNEKAKIELDFSELLRKTRKIDETKGVIIQNLPRMSDDNLTYEEVIDNPYVKYFNKNQNYLKYIDIANRAVLKSKKNFKSVERTAVKLKYVYIQPRKVFKKVDGKIIIENDGYDIDVRHTKVGVEFFRKNYKFDEKDVKMLTYDQESGANIIVIGLYILMVTKGELKLTDGDMKVLKAYYPTSNLEFHKQCSASVSTSKLCIYETFRDLIGKVPLKYSRKDNKNYREKLYKDLNDEGLEIEEAVKDGNLITSLQLLTKKYKTEVLVVFYGSQLSLEDENIEINGDRPIYINNGELKDCKDKDIKAFKNKKCFLYEKHKHVAPFMLKLRNNSKLIEAVNKNKNNIYRLKKIDIKNLKNEYDGIFGYDLETFKEGDNVAKPFACCLYGEYKGENVSKKFYGTDCINKFIDYLETIFTRKNEKKTRPKYAIKPIYIYGFNNSRFDNLFIYSALYSRDPSTEYIFTGNSIKYMRYNNINFYDISLFYAGSLEAVAGFKGFNLEISKGVYPYSFPNSKNLDYVGEIPDVKYWSGKGQADIDEYIKNEGEEFNMKAYTLKYCTLDSKLVYEIAKIHIKNCIGELLGRKFNVIEKKTGAGLAMGMFQQVFLKDMLFESKKEILEKEKIAYKGGRTEVFKKYFKAKKNNELYYFDINSSYSSSMRFTMPFKYQSTTKFNDEIFKKEEIIDHYLYYARSIYLGNDLFVIPNLLIRNDDENIISVKNTEYSYHWGIELKEAIKNGFQIRVSEINKYEGKIIFKEFAEYFYNERLNIKKTNPALAMFYKLLMNSLYGKFGQRVFNKTALTEYSQLHEILNNDSVKLIDFKELDNEKLLIEYKVDGDEEQSIGKLMRFASYITARSRSLLSEVMRDCEHKNIYYCDTDSIFTSKRPSEKYLDNAKLGMWKQENESPIKEAVFLAPKAYYYKLEDGKEEKKAKGMNAKNITREDYVGLQDGSKKDVVCGMTMFKRTFNKITIDEKAERRLNVVYNKRKWIDDFSIPYYDMNEYNFNSEKGKKIIEKFKRTLEINFV